jgi:hypothetical protein
VSGGRRWSSAPLWPPGRLPPRFRPPHRPPPPLRLPRRPPSPLRPPPSIPASAALTPGNPPTAAPPSPQDEGENGEVQEGRALTRNSFDCSAGPKDDESTTRSKTRWPEPKKTTFALSIADTLGQFLWRGVSWRWGGGGRVLGRSRGQPEQRRGGVMFDSGTVVSVLSLRPPLLRVSRSGCYIGTSTAAPQSSPSGDGWLRPGRRWQIDGAPPYSPAVSGLGRVGSGRTVQAGRGWPRWGGRAPPRGWRRAPMAAAKEPGTRETADLCHGIFHFDGWILFSFIFYNFYLCHKLMMRTCVW